MALDNVMSHFSTVLEAIASGSFLSSLSIIHGLAERSVRMRVSVNTVVASRCFAFRALITQARI